jgi:pimeloyl-ACP methyl ester carboxylesterase
MNTTIDNFLSDKNLNKEIFKPLRYKISDYHLVECEGAKLYCSYFPVLNPVKTVVFFYGNGECADDYIEMKYHKIFNEMFCSLLIVEYRGYGMSTGTPTLPAIMKDVYHIIKSLSLKEKDIILYGRSLGIFPVIEGISRFPNLSGVILDSCFAEPTAFLNKRFGKPMDKELNNSIATFFDFDIKIKKFNGSALIFHTKNDNLVPFQNALILEKKFGQNSELITFENGSHNTILYYNQNEYLKKIKEFVFTV